MEPAQLVLGMTILTIAGRFGEHFLRKVVGHYCDFLPIVQNLPIEPLWEQFRFFPTFIKLKRSRSVPDTGAPF